MRFPKSLAVSSRAFSAAIVAASLLVSVDAFARPGGGGGGRSGPEPAAGGRGGPGAATRPAPDRAEPGRAEAGRAIDGGAANRPAPGTRDVESFLNTKPAAGAAAKPAADRATAKSRAESAQSSFQTAMEGRTQPFTPAWYSEHPDAWQYTHPHADLWAVAGVAGLTTWLGYPATAATTTAATSTTVAATSATTTATGTEAAAAATATSTDGNASNAAALPPDLEWMPLGVYATGPKDAAQAHVYQQLAVSKQGELKGNYYDSITNTTQPVSGSIDRETRKASWKVGGKGGATFETTLDALMKTPSDVTMKSGGATHEWELVQVQKPDDKAAKP
ncbi:MAG: hypothetical protein WCO99_05840 [Planctomycetota bacterium]